MLILPLLLAFLTPVGEGPAAAQLVAAPRDWVEWAQISTVDGQPRVWLRATEDGPTRRAKVGGAATGVLRLRVPPLEQGSYDLLVRMPKKKSTGSEDLLVVPDALRVEVPGDLALTPGDARPGDILEVTGRHLGPRRGRVEIASRRARVLSWEPGVAVDADGAPLDRVRIRVPRRLGDGVHPITVTTAAGDGWLADAVSITGSEHGVEPVLRSEAGELRFEAKAASIRWEFDEANGVALLRGFDGKGKRGHWLRVALRYDPAVQGPAELRGNDAIVQLVRLAPGDSQAWSSAYGWGGYARVDIVENQDGLLRGTLTGWLEPVYGKAVALPIEASFSVRLD